MGKSMLSCRDWSAKPNWGYYLVPEAPYVPPCLRGARLGQVDNFRSSKEGQPCSLSGAQQVEISTLEDGKVGMV